MKTYPICLINLDVQNCIVVGGGPVAARKIAGLLEAGARLRAISPQFEPQIQALAEDGRLELVPRGYQPGDLVGARLVIAATNDARVNQAVWAEAVQRGCLVNVVDDPEHCNFILPAVVRREDLAVAVTTGGSSPALARRLRERLDAQIGDEYGQLARILGHLRPQLTERIQPRSRLEVALELIDSELLEVIRTQGYEAGAAYAQAYFSEIAARTQDENDA